MYRLYANTMPFYMRDLNIGEFWKLEGPRTHLLWILRDDLIHFKWRLHLQGNFLCSNPRSPPQGAQDLWNLNFITKTPWTKPSLAPLASHFFKYFYYGNFLTSSTAPPTPLHSSPLPWPAYVHLLSLEEFPSTCSPLLCPSLPSWCRTSKTAALEASGFSVRDPK